MKHFTNETIATWMWIGFCACLLSACSNTRFLPQGRSLHDKTTITLETNFLDKQQFDWLGTTLDSEKMMRKHLRQIQTGLYKIPPKINSTSPLISLKYKLYIYNKTQDKRGSLNRWMHERLGEPPTLLDSARLDRSITAMQQYLFNEGFFYHDIDYSTKTKRKRSEVSYSVILKQPYLIDSIFLPQESGNPIHQIVQQIAPKSFLKVGKQFSVDNLQKEMNRITTELRNKGYYDFNQRQYLSYRLDSSKQNHKISVYLDLASPADSTVHQQYYINDVFIYAHYTAEKNREHYADTILIDGYHYITPKPLEVRPETITNFLLIKPNDRYSQRKYDYAINHLLELGAFKFANIRYQKIAPSQSDKQLLDCHIYLTPAKKTQLSAEFELNNRNTIASTNTNFLGAALAFSYRNKNTLKGAETFSLNPFFGVEFANKLSDPINTLDGRLEANLNVPRIILLNRLRNKEPFKTLFDNQSSYFRPKTNISFGTGLLRRVNFYTLNSYNATLGFNWRENSRKRHILNPISINLFTVPVKELPFQALLAQSDYLTRSFEDQVIIGSNYTYIYSNQSNTSLKNFIFFRGNFEGAGNLLFLGEQALKRANFIADDRSLTVFGNPYSKFVRFDADIRYYNVIDETNKVVFRIASGVGLPYGATEGNNFAVLPYVKQFYVGGANSIRAFEIRTIGPGTFGSSVDTTISEFDRTGDLKIEANVEYRFDMYSFFEGALFLDVGNVWTLNNDPERPGTQFQASTFLNQMAIGSGVGLRVNLGYFIMRFDWGIPIRDPSQPVGERIVVSHWQLKDVTFNLGIGYPF
ncbi:MAG: BamA/TamA family outer membrane protein [Chitinophagales bacterium]